MEVSELRAWPSHMQTRGWEADFKENRLSTNYHTNPPTGGKFFIRRKHSFCFHVKLSVKHVILFIASLSFFSSNVEIRSFICWNFTLVGIYDTAQPVTPPTVYLSCALHTHPLYYGSGWTFIWVYSRGLRAVWIRGLVGTRLLMCALVYIHAPGVIGASWDQHKL